MFKQGVPASTNVRVSYLNSVTNASYFSNHTINLNDPEAYPYVDKMAHFKALEILTEAMEDSKKLKTDISLSKVGDLKDYIVKESIRHQVLCKLTAFICVQQKMVDGKYE